ncbi:hypothetical protein RJ640_001652 [Escallonia rubra]|uniref:PGG domain-containing protein n=1 Tax=Escallonia rubra TaxID=112253 RepID=A0AA88S2S7_9ASTE|nr:hypothetical protein RJ640_001652 [Escallonia rubra]
MEEDRLTLARISVTFNETPLHIAAMLGHAAFAKALVGYQPNLVRERDSQGCSPLHLASANGYVEIVKLLLVEDSSVCHVRDQDGRTPLHLAVMKGRDDVIRELVSAQEQVTRFTLDRGETILHLCVKHNHLETLKQLAELGGDLANAQDDNGNTILHAATALKQMETMKYLLREHPGVRVNALNANGFTALDVIEHVPKDMKSVDIRDLLVAAGALRAIDLSPVSRATNSATTGDDHDNGITSSVLYEHRALLPRPPSRGSRMKKPTWWKKIHKVTMNRSKKQHTWLEKKYDALLVAATLIAAMAYQATLNPPGGIRQDDKTVDFGGNKTINFYAGTSTMAAHFPIRFDIFWICNTMSFLAALSVVFLVVSGLPLKQRIFAWLLMKIMWVAITSMAAMYVQSVKLLTPRNIGSMVENWTYDDFASLWKRIVDTVGMVGVVLVVHICRFLIWITRILCKYCRKKRVSSPRSHGESSV